MRKGIASIRRGTLSGEVTAAKKKAQRGHAWKGRGTWTGMQRVWQAIPRGIKKKNMRQAITSTRKGTLSGEVTSGEMKMRRRRPQASWGLPEEQKEDLQNKGLRFQRRAMYPAQKQEHKHYKGC